MTRLWLVRHGPTHVKSMVGWSDVPADLSDTAAIARLREYLPDVPMISSDLVRAVATADALNPSHRLPHDPALREINFGEWELQNFQDIATHDPETISAFWDTPGDIAPPQGESWNTVRARVNAVIDRLISLSHDDVIVVGHFGMILTQVQRALGISGYETFGHKIDNLSVTVIEHDAGSWRTSRINHTP